MVPDAVAPRGRDVIPLADSDSQAVHDALAQASIDLLAARVILQGEPSAASVHAARALLQSAGRRLDVIANAIDPASLFFGAGVDNPRF